ncbi:MAG: hypothetical protein KJZ80_01295 [Hyphomicrobiaceae bacterium]|nr:hypothetical protein [Hyphomicrobiaceae bacterium]
MGLVGDGVLGVWHGIAPGMERKFDDWYNTEHNAERVAIEGFLRARRYINLRRGRRYFCRYDVEDVSVLGSRAYLDALDNPTPRSRSNFPHYRNTLRGAFRVVERHGRGDGGYVLSCRFPETGLSSEAASPEAGLAELADQLLESPVVTCVERWEVEPAVTAIASQEKALRKAADESPGRVYLIDGSDPDGIEAALDAVPARRALRDAEIDVCKLVFHLARTT